MLSILLSFSLAACGNATPPVTSPTTAPAENSEVTFANVAQTDVMQGNTEKAPVSYSVYEDFGLKFDPDKNELTFENELVRYFYDGVSLEDGTESVYCDYLNEKGTVDIHTIRKTINNKDGSADPFGELMGIERYTQEEFDNRDLSDFYGSSNAVAYAFGNYDPTALTFVERFEAYKEFGIEYVEAQSASGAGNIYYNGQLVKTFVDTKPNGGTFSFNSADGGKINVQTIYDSDGNLTGVEKIN